MYRGSSQPESEIKGSQSVVLYPTVDMRHSVALSLLRGSDAHLTLCCLSMVMSLVIAVVGIARMTDDEVKRIIAIQAVVFLMAQAFWLTRVWRDWTLSTESETAKPSVFYVSLVACLFTLAVVLVIYCLEVVIDWHGFYVISSLWVMFSAVMLSKAVRDRDFANKSLQHPVQDVQGHSEHLLHVVATCRDSLVDRVLTWFSAVLAVSMTLGFMWTWDSESMMIIIKAFMTLCTFWSEGSTFHLAKLLHDRADPNKKRELREQLGFQILVVFSTIVSYTVPLIVVVVLPDLHASKRFYLLCGLGFMMSTAFFLVKHVRDQLEFKRLVSPMDQAIKGPPQSQVNAQPAPPLMPPPILQRNFQEQMAPRNLQEQMAPPVPMAPRNFQLEAAMDPRSYPVASRSFQQPSMSSMDNTMAQLEAAGMTEQMGNLRENERALQSLNSNGSPQKAPQDPRWSLVQ